MSDDLDDFDKALAAMDTTKEKPSSVYGDAELAADISVMLDGVLGVTDAYSLIRQYGALKVQLAAKRLAKSDFTKIENLSAALRLVIESGSIDHLDVNVALSSQNRPNSLPNGSNPGIAEQRDSSADHSQLSEIDKLRKGSMWTAQENREWYLNLPRNIRAIVVEDAVHKWLFLDEYARKEGIDMTSNNFAHDRMFGVHFSRVINVIRFDNVSRHLRSRVENGLESGME